MADNDDPLVPAYIPSLAVTLLEEEKRRGRPLTEDEVVEIRDQATVMMLRRSEVQRMARSSGYEEIDPDDCWRQYLALRERLKKKG